MKKRIALPSVLIAIMLAAALPTNAGQSGQSDKWIAPIASLLEKSGYNYTKVDNGVWEVQFKGKNLDRFVVRVVVADDLVLTMARLAEPNALRQTDKLFQKLVELNDKMDSVKFALSSDMLYVRSEVHARLVDRQELTYMLEQTAAAVNQAYPDIRPFIVDPK